MDAQQAKSKQETQDTPGRRRRRSRALWIASVLGLALVAGTYVTVSYAGAAGGSGSAKNAKAKDGKDAKNEVKAVPVSVAAVTQGTVSSYLSATANIVPDNEVEILAEAEGRVSRLAAEEGDYVAKGQVLVTLDRGDHEIAFNKAKLKTTNARLAYERGEKMVRESLISQEAFDKMTMDHEVARQELAEAEYRLSKTSIRAPFAGRITLRGVEPGQHVRPGDKLFTVADFEPLVARIYLPEKDVLGLEVGQEARLTLKAAESVRFAGRIRQVSPVVDAATGTVKVTIEAVRPPASVRPGGFVTVEVVRETRAKAVLVPRQAVLRELGSAHVFVARNGKAERRAVALGLEEGDNVQAVSGLAVGDQVVVAGQGSLKPGAAVKILAAAAQASTAQRIEPAR
jgi:RND family efflux transporter MFP subunit